MQLATSSEESDAAAERKALLTLFWCTAGPGWIEKSGWQDGDSDLTEWCGVGVDPTDSGVTLIDLRRNGLAGAMPPELGDLKLLRHLFLGDNELQGSHMNTWEAILKSSMKQVFLLLQSQPLLLRPASARECEADRIPTTKDGLYATRPPLELFVEIIMGSIPTSIGKLSHLCILSLRGNNLKGDIVPELGDLTALETLSLRDNRLTGTIPRELGKLKLLRHLFLNNNHLRGTIPEELSQLRELEQLFLGDNDLEGPIPLSLGGLMQLKELVLSGNQLAGCIPVELADLTELTRLELDGNRLTGDIPSGLCALSNLKVLYVNNNELTGPVPSELGMLSWLERLDLSENQLTGEIPAELGQLFSLELLMLSSNKLVGAIPCELGRLHHIKLLLLGGNQLSETPPIVGGKGLRQWQVAQRKAFLNGWSMMERLTHLERENAFLRRENDLLKKDGWERCPTFYRNVNESPHASSVPSTSPLPVSPHPLYYTPRSSPTNSSCHSPAPPAIPQPRTTTPALAYPIQTPPPCKSERYGFSYHSSPSSSLAGLATPTAATDDLRSYESASASSHLTQREGAGARTVVQDRAVTGDDADAIVAGHGRDCVQRSKWGSAEGNGLPCSIQADSFSEEKGCVERNVTRRALLAQGQRLSRRSSAQSLAGGDAKAGQPAAAEEEGVKIEPDALDRNAVPRQRAAVGMAADAHVREVGSSKRGRDGALSAAGRGNGEQATRVKGVESVSRSPMTSPMIHQDVGESTGGDEPAAPAPPCADVHEGSEKEKDALSIARSWASLVGMGAARADNGVGARSRAAAAAAAAATNGGGVTQAGGSAEGEGDVHDDNDDEDPPSRRGSSLNSPLSQMVLGLFGVALTDSSTPPDRGNGLFLPDGATSKWHGGSTANSGQKPE